MKIYDSIYIKNNSNNKLLKKLKEIIKKKNIKLIQQKNNSKTERSILEIDIKEDGYYIDNNQFKLKQIFNNYTFVPNLYIEKSSEEEYIKDYSKIIIEKKKKANLLLKNHKYSKYFDNVTGSIYIPDEEYYLLDNTKLKEFIFTENNNEYKYVIPNENGYLLRGAMTYYYLLSTKGKYNHVLEKHFEEFQTNYHEYFKSISKLIPSDKYNKENNLLVLSLLDNIRNYVLILINLIVISKQTKDETFLYELTNDNSYGFLNTLYDVYNQMESIIIKDNYNENIIKTIIKRIVSFNIMKIVKNTDSCFYDKMLKSHRECDNFLENYLLVCEYYKKNIKENNFVGILYGCVEIPLIAYYLYNKNSRVYYVTLYGIYKDRHKKVLKYNNPVFDLRFDITNIINDGCVICDDNILTGKTIQCVIDSLTLNKIKVNNILTINHVNLNRIYQILDNDLLLNLELIDKYIFGMLYDTKYSKNKKDTNIGKTYLDEFNIFDLSKEYICYYIYKNGIYTKESRINNYSIKGVRK